jgi:hypothetical protein
LLGFTIFTLLVEVRASLIRWPVVTPLMAFAAVYVIAICSLPGKRIWALRFCWIAACVILILGSLAIFGLLYDDIEHAFRFDASHKVVLYALVLVLPAALAMLLHRRVRNEFIAVRASATLTEAHKD